jgi:hypothetical protein
MSSKLFDKDYFGGKKFNVVINDFRAKMKLNSAGGTARLLELRGVTCWGQIVSL